MPEQFPYNGDPRLSQPGESYDDWSARRKEEIAAEKAKLPNFFDGSMPSLEELINPEPPADDPHYANSPRPLESYAEFLARRKEEEAAKAAESSDRPDPEQ